MVPAAAKRRGPSMKDSAMTTRAITSKPNMFTRFWRWLELVGETMDVTEASILEKRVAALEREVASLRAERSADRVDAVN